jgi:tRNA dimethylallyltransferase
MSVEKRAFLIAIVGPTASGKTNLTIRLAKKFKGEIISADSRQVYKGFDIGTAKITKKEMMGIPHYLLNIVSPRTRFTVTQYQKLTLKAIEKIQKKGKLPILCGGTGFYIQAVIDGIAIPEVKPDWKLRKELEKKSARELWQKLKNLDPTRAKTIEKDNKRRVVRALEIVLKTKKSVPSLKLSPLPYPVLQIGIKFSQEILKQRIKKRFFQWLREGFLAEVKKLRRSGVSWKRIEGFGLHYRQAALYLQNKISYSEMVASSLKGLNDYSRRQTTWFKKDKRIRWVKNYKIAERLVKKFTDSV